MLHKRKTHLATKKIGEGGGVPNKLREVGKNRKINKRPPCLLGT